MRNNQKFKCKLKSCNQLAERQGLCLEHEVEEGIMRDMIKKINGGHIKGIFGV